MIKQAISISTLMVLAGMMTGVASAEEYDFKDPKGVNTIVFMLDSTLEPIMGVADGISGKVNFNPANPKATTGTISLEVKSIHTPNRGMKNKIQAEDWLDGTTHKTIDFTVKKVEEVSKPKPGVFEMQVVGELSCKGIKKEIKTNVTAVHMPGKMSSRQSRAEGDLLVLRSKFSINRKDFGIKPDMGGDVVAEEIELRVSIVGGHATK